MITELQKGDTFTNGRRIIRVDDFFMDIIYVSKFDAAPPHDLIDMFCVAHTEVFKAVNTAGVTRWNGEAAA